MRKVNMKRKSRAEKVEQQNSDEENGVDEKSNDPKSSDEETKDSESEAEPESKKRKSDKRKSVSFTNKKSPKKDVTPESEPEPEPEYEVEEILDEKMVRGARHYLIRWKGYEPESDSWEPESTLDCPEVIKKFKASRAEKDKATDEKSESPKKGKKGEKNKSNNESISETTKKGKKGEKDKTDDENASDSIKKGKKDKSKKIKTVKKNKPFKTEPEVDWESGDEFEVGSIQDVYFKRNGGREFLVQWKGYPLSQASWEPEENLDCKDLISKFMNKVNAAKNVEQKELRVNRIQTERFTLNMYDGSSKGRRLSRRLGKKQRVQYHDAE